MSRIWATGLIMSLAIVQAQAQAQSGGTSNTNCENGTCKQQVCKTDSSNNTVCNSTSYSTSVAAPSRDELRRLARESDERDEAWVKRCKPEIYTDAQGLDRYRYAAPHCDVQVLSKQ